MYLIILFNPAQQGFIRHIDKRTPLKNIFAAINKSQFKQLHIKLNSNN